MFGEHDLSGGQWQQLAVACMLAHNACLLILDEPSAHLDACTAYELFRKFASIEIVPTHRVWTEFPRGWALHSYHWMFMAQPYDFPERLLSGNLEYYMQKKLEKHMHGQGGLEPEAVAEYLRCCTPAQIHGVCEDYRAAATLDFEMDTADFDAGHKITCPVLVLWGDKSHVEQYFKPRQAWPQYASDVVRYVVVPAGHYPQEQAPDEVYAALEQFFRA